jgi:SAM-dependent methyltransferase
MFVRIATGLAAAAALAAAQTTTEIPYSDARPAIEAHAADLPADLAALDPGQRQAAWPGWVSRHNAEIRARLEQGDEDSVVNLWLYGTTFTRLPRVTDRQAAQLRDRDAVEALLLNRLDAFVTALAQPGGPRDNERLQFARALLARAGITLSTEAGREQAKIFLVRARERVIAENEQYRRAAESPSAYATLFRDRGLSSDTRLTASFAVDKALGAIAASGRLPAGTIARVAIVGPGLDFTDKAEGYDFYPLQTIQPFGVIDSLLRLKLSKGAGAQVVTLDLSPRVNGHLDRARRRAAAGGTYTIQLPLATDDAKHQWDADLVAYWQRFGHEVGTTVKAAVPPAIVGSVRLRAVSIRPSVVLSIAPRDVNIIVERLDPLSPDERFDLVIATNILVYYNAFDQSLALANIAKMLRPGGFFLTNYPVTPLPPMDTSASIVTPVFFDRQGNGDTLYAYQRRE